MLTARYTKEAWLEAQRYQLIAFLRTQNQPQAIFPLPVPGRSAVKLTRAQILQIMFTTIAAREKSRRSQATSERTLRRRKAASATLAPGNTNLFTVYRLMARGLVSTDALCATTGFTEITVRLYRRRLLDMVLAGFWPE